MSDADPVILDSGPIIALSCVGYLDLLKTLYPAVWIPEAVFREVVIDGAGQPGSKELPAASWIERRTVTPSEQLLQHELGAGEAEAIALAYQHNAKVVLLDDRRARRIARLAFSLPVRGTAAVIVKAHREGLVSSVRAVLQAMRSNGYFLSDRLVATACAQAGETA